jgi:hypothetical protein
VEARSVSQIQPSGSVSYIPPPHVAAKTVAGDFGHVEGHAVSS